MEGRIRRLFATVLSVVMVLGLMPAPALAELFDEASGAQVQEFSEGQTAPFDEGSADDSLDESAVTELVDEEANESLANEEFEELSEDITDEAADDTDVAEGELSNEGQVEDAEEEESLDVVAQSASQELPLNTRKGGGTLNSGESKEFYFTLDEGSSVTILIEWYQKSGANNLFDIDLYSLEGTRVMHCAATRENADVCDTTIKTGTHLFPGIYLPAGRWRMAFTSHATGMILNGIKVSTGGVDGSYAYDLEPNDELTFASSLPLGEDVTGSLYDASQHGNRVQTPVDCYAITLDEWGSLNVHLYLAATSDLIIEVLDAQGNPMGTLSSGTGISGSDGFYHGSMCLDDCAPGTYYLRVSGTFYCPAQSSLDLTRRATFYSTLVYCLSVDSTPNGMHYPQGDPIALELGEDCTYRVVLDEGASQAYEFTTAADDAAIIGLMASGPMGNDPSVSITLSRPDGTEMQTWSAGASNADGADEDANIWYHVFSPLLLSEGTWRVELTSHTDGLIVESINAKSAGDTAIRSGVDILECEYNDSQETATVLPLGNIACGATYDPRSHGQAGVEGVDWYKVTVDSEDAYELELSSPLTGVQANVYDSSGELISNSNTSSGTSTSGWYAESDSLGTLAEGTYYVRVSQSFDEDTVAGTAYKSKALYLLRLYSPAAVAAASYALLAADGTVWRCSSDGSPTSNKWTHADRNAVTKLYVAADARVVPAKATVAYTRGSSTSYSSIPALMTGIKSIEFLTDDDGASAVASIADGAFSDLPITEVVGFENTKVTQLGSNVFDGCSALTSITLPPTVESIGGYAFYGCSQLSTLAVAGSDLPELSGDNIFSGTPLALSSSSRLLLNSEILWSKKLSSADSGWQELKAQVAILPGTEIEIGEVSYSGLKTCYYDGVAKTQSLVLTYEGEELVQGTDYTLSYKNNTNVGTATVTIVGKGCFTGTRTLTYRIVEKISISRATVTGISSKTYTGRAIRQSPKVVVRGKTLKLNTDYTLSYRNNVNAGTATLVIKGKNAYKDSVTKKFKINPRNVAKTTVTGVKSSYLSTGKAIKPRPTVKYGATRLRVGTHYTLTYRNNTKPGTATVIITGKGNYGGTKRVTFKIARAVTPKAHEYQWNPEVIKGVPRVAKGRSVLSCRGDEGYVKFVAPATGRYAFTFSGLKRLKSSFGVYGYFYLQTEDEILSVTTQGGTFGGDVPNGGYSFNIASAGWADTSGRLADRHLASRYGRVRLKKGQVVYLYVYTTALSDGWRLTLDIS